MGLLRRLFCVLAGWLSCCACFAQGVSIGVVGGVRTTDDMGGVGTISVSERYLVGPALGLGLGHRFGVEVDGLYRREGFDAAHTILNEYNLSITEHANSWEFPALVRYRLPFVVAKPFVEAGYALRFIHGQMTTTEAYLTHALISQVTSKTAWPASDGVVAGAGVDLELGHLRLSPTLRYTRWVHGGISGTYADGTTWGSAANQLDLVVEIAWKSR